MEARVYDRWEEVAEPSEKGGKMMYYHVVGCGGRSDLAIVGREKRHGYVSYTVVPQFLKGLGVSPPGMKLRKRKDVVARLRSLISAKIYCPRGSSHSSGSSLVYEPSSRQEEPPMKKVRYVLESFSWLGTPWICKKRRRHFKSFRRNGFTISVNDFVYVMAEECKRLVAYLEDMFEDNLGNCMVVARWFHRIDEVGYDLLSRFNGREIFFSLCLQDLSVECIDGLATVLSPEHFNVYFDGSSASTRWDPYVCQCQYEDGDITPFDITQIKGYWNQEVIRCKFGSAVSANTSRDIGELISTRNNLLRKQTPNNSHQKTIDGSVVKMKEKISFSSNSTLHVDRNAGEPHLSVGCDIEVLSQDSGIRGCWFRATIIKKHKQKVKVCYHDLHGADESGNVEEWLPEVRVALADKLGMRLCGRATIRPHPPFVVKNSDSFDVGTAVDAWWHDGWWEGIIVTRENDGFLIYFPGEGHCKLFRLEDLRCSQDWLDNKWNPIKVMPHLLNSVLDKIDMFKVERPRPFFADANGQSRGDSYVEDFSEPVQSPSVSDSKGELQSDFSDLHLDGIIPPWNCKIPKKRRRGRDTCPRGGNLSTGRQCDEERENCSLSNQAEDGSLGPQREAISNTLKVDREICKYGTNPLFMAASMRPLSSLVMSR